MAFPSSSSFDSSNEPMPQSETDDNFLTETAISKEVNISNEGVIEEDLVCMHCHTLEKENRRLRNRIVTLEEQVSRRKRESRRYRRRGKKPCKKVLPISDQVNFYNCSALRFVVLCLFIGRCTDRLIKNKINVWVSLCIHILVLNSYNVQVLLTEMVSETKNSTIYSENTLFYFMMFCFSYNTKH